MNIILIKTCLNKRPCLRSSSANEKEKNNLSEFVTELIGIIFHFHFFYAFPFVERTQILYGYDFRINHHYNILVI